MTRIKVSPAHRTIVGSGRGHSPNGPPVWSWQMTVKRRALQRAHSKRLRARRRR